MYKIFIHSIIVSLLFVSFASAQWWVKGGNLLWPYGTVSVSDSLAVGKNALIKNNLSVNNNLDVTNSISAGNISVENQINSTSINSFDAYFENLTVTGTINANTSNASDIKVYTALLSQESTSNPEAFVLENTLGFEISWLRESTGRYTGYFSTQIEDPKSLFIIAPSINLSDIDFNFYTINFIVTNTTIHIRQDHGDISSWIGAVINYDGSMYYPIKIIQYPVLRSK